MSTAAPVHIAVARYSNAGAPLACALAVLLVLALQFGPTIGLLGYLATADYRWTLQGAARDALVVALVGLAMLVVLTRTQAQRLPGSARWALAIVVIYSLLALLASSQPVLLALNLRRLVLVPLLFVAVLLIPWSPSQIDRLLALVITSSVVVALVGLAERFAPVVLWTDWLAIEQFTAANPLDRFGLNSFEESGRFFSWDLELWGHGPVRRMVSTYLEPTTLAAGMSVLLVLALALRPHAQGVSWAALLALLCGVLTVSKGFVLFVALLLAWRLVGFPGPRHLVWLALVIVPAALLAVAGGLGPGPQAHLMGLESGLRHLAEGNLLGEGIGELGNYAATDDDTGAESGLGNAIAQVGVAAFLPLLWLRAVALEVLAASQKRRFKGGVWLAMWPLFWLTSYLFSASSLGVGGNALGFLVLALVLHPAWRAR
jgi:hypothetical protein